MIWRGNDGTFAAPSEVELPLGRPVDVPVGYAPKSMGVHQAILQIVDPANDLVLGRSPANAGQHELSLADCNKIIQLRTDDPRGYNCRGFGRQMLTQYNAALADFNEAIRRNPNFAIAYEHRGTTYSLLQQYDRTVQDYSEAIHLGCATSKCNSGGVLFLWRIS